MAGEDLARAHLELLRQDARDEVKKRIEQRDKYSIQLTTSLGAIVAFSFSPIGLGKALIAAPLVSIYFTVLILYSYRVHRLLAEYLRRKIEPELAGLYRTALDLEWETFYQTQAVPGIRKGFFMVALWAVSVGVVAYVWNTDPDFRSILYVVSAAYFVANAAITIIFWPSS